LCACSVALALPAAVVQGAGPKQLQLFPQDMRLQRRYPGFAKLQPSLATPDVFVHVPLTKKPVHRRSAKCKFSAPHVTQIFSDSLLYIQHPISHIQHPTSNMPANFIAACIWAENHILPIPTVSTFRNVALFGSGYF